MFGFLNKIVKIICPFTVRTVFIHTLGAEFLGLDSLFLSILSVLNITELGFSSAIVFSMYKPIALNDRFAINALLFYYKKIYLCVGLIILFLGLLIIPFLPHFIHGDYPKSIQLPIAYLVYLGNTVLSYFLFAYLRSLISAHQREDVLSKINTFVSVGMYTFQIVALFVVKNYYAYILIMPLSTILENIWTAIITRKMFPYYRPIGSLAPTIRADIREKVSGLAIGKICSVTRNAFDSIFVSMYLGLKETAIYNNYYYIMSAVTTILMIFGASILAGVGNSVAIDSVDKNYNDMKRLNFIYMWASGWCTICLLCLYQPFMRIWIGEAYLLPFVPVLLFCVYFYILKTGDIITIYVAANGLWWHTKYRALAEATTNILLNWILGKYFGIIGILSATVFSLSILCNYWGPFFVFKYYFTEQDIGEYFRFHSFFAFVTFIVAGITYLICNFISETFLGLFEKTMICLFIPNMLYFMFLRKTAMYSDALFWVMSKVKK